MPFRIDRDIEILLDPLDVMPIELRLVDAGVVDAHPAALVALGDVALAPAVAVGVDRQAKGIIALVDSAADMVVDPGGIAAHVQLENLEAVTGGFGCLVEPRMRYRAQDHAIAEFARRRGDGGAAARLEHFQRADRRAQHRDAQLFAEQCAAAVDVRYIAQYPRPEADRIERQPIARQGRFGLGAADQIVPVIAVEIGSRLRDELVQVLKAVLERLGHSSATSLVRLLWQGQGF